jgi:small subunit ribosomal protein S21
MITVKLDMDESFESLLRRFKKRVKKSGLLEELEERRFYKKPSDLKKECQRRRKKTLEKLKEENLID